MIESQIDDIAIFYNVYIPENKDLALNIVKEQLQYKEDSIYPRAPLHYMTIGKDIGELENCNNCKKIHHHNIGNEIETLSSLYEYCTTHQSEKVAYLHNKGSFHPNLVNDRLRNMLNKAVFSEECLLLKTPSDTNTFTISAATTNTKCKCNICSSRFSPTPYFYMSGNMWVSHCSYISKLIHPSNFTSTMNEMVQSAPIEKFGDISKLKHYDIGLGRFAAEHWVASHPDSCPCDVYPGTKYRDSRFHLPVKNTWIPELLRAPRESVFGREVSNFGFNKSEHNWFGTEGRIYEYQYLYKKIPDDDSWFWKYYPHVTGSK